MKRYGFSYTELQNIYSLEKNLQPPSESTKLEHADGFVEYVGSGKLKDKNVLITGGELVQLHLMPPRESYPLKIAMLIALVLADPLRSSWQKRVPM